MIETTPTYKKSLAEAEAGDVVVLRFGSAVLGPQYQLRKVERITTTQVVVDGCRFRKSDGREIGSTYHPNRIYAPLEEVQPHNGATEQGETYLDRQTSAQHEYDEQKAKRPYIGFLSNLHHNRLQVLDSATLKQAAELLGYKGEG